jgi:hypothetical protein
MMPGIFKAVSSKVGPKFKLLFFATNLSRETPSQQQGNHTCRCEHCAAVWMTTVITYYAALIYNLTQPSYDNNNASYYYSYPQDFI